MGFNLDFAEHEGVTSMARPVFNELWRNFPDHVRYPTLKDLYTWLGGRAALNINAQGFGPNGNTCASRLSVAFNHAGAPITSAAAGAAGAQTISCADGSRIIFRVTEFRAYLLKALGKPQTDLTSPFDSNFAGQRGIIAFKVNWGDASGHIALWNGARYREEHDNYATYVHPLNPAIKTSAAEFWPLA